MILTKELSHSSNTLTALAKAAPSLLTRIQTTLKPTPKATCGKVICGPPGTSLLEFPMAMPLTSKLQEAAQKRPYKDYHMKTLESIHRHSVN